ncbi:MAG: HAD family hydrolase [Promethearchaeota archaeon]
MVLKQNKTKLPLKVDGFIFDLDDTLIKSTKFHYKAWKFALDKFGIIKSKEEVIAEFGNATNKIGIKLAGDKEIGEKLAKTKTDYLLNIIQEVPEIDHASSLLKELKKKGKKIAFASSNFESIIVRILEAKGWIKIADYYIGIDRVNHPKPNPEMIAKCIENLRLKPEKCVMIGDSVYDVIAANKAGVISIGVCSGNNTVQTFEIYNPDFILKDISALGDIQII